MSAKNKLSLSVQYPDTRLQDSVTRQKVRRWVQAALLGPAELTIRFVDTAEGRVLKRVDGIAITRFTSADVVRHPLVARIVDAYDSARKRTG